MAKTKPIKGQAKRKPGRIKEPRYPHNPTWLKAQMLIAGVSQRDMAHGLGVDYATINHLVTGRRPMGDKDAAKFAKALNIPLGMFLAKVRSTRTPTLPEALGRGIAGRGIEITGWVDGRLVVHAGKPKGPGKAPVPTEGGEAVRVVRCQTQGSDFDGIDGALVYFKELTTVAAGSVGRMCVVATGGGETVLRVVKRGYSEGKFNLSMLNGVLSEEDATLLTASPVIWLRM